MLMRTRWFGTTLIALIAAGLPYAAIAQERSAAKIAVLDDMSGPYSGVNGPGNVLSARMAIEDFGGKVLGQPVELVSADDQNRPDTGLTIARHWIDLDHVTLITGLGNSAVALGVQNFARERKVVDIVVGGVTYDLTGKDCSPTGFHWIHDSRSLATGVARAVAAENLKTWFFVTVDYTFGAGLEREASAAVIRDGGTVVGTTKFPFKTTDFSSYILQAQNSKAKVVALATAGADLINAVKAAREFGVQANGQTLAAFAFYPTDVDAIGIETAQGLLTSSAFFSGLDDATRVFNQRFAARHNGVGPTPNQAGVYSAVKHYLEAVAAAGTVDGPAVAQKMKELRVNDFMSKDVMVRADGQVLRDTYVLRVKAPKNVRFPYDYFTLVDTISGNVAFRSLADGGCPYVK